MDNRENLDNPCAPVDGDFPAKPAPLSPDDAAQAFIEGIISKIGNELLTPDEACALACGRVQTVIMENVSELRLMNQDENEPDVARNNAAILAQAYKVYADEMRATIRMIMKKKAQGGIVVASVDEAQRLLKRLNRSAR